MKKMKEKWEWKKSERKKVEKSKNKKVKKVKKSKENGWTMMSKWLEDDIWEDRRFTR